MTGEFTGTADFDPGSPIMNLVSAGAGDVFITKLNSLGDFIWALNFGSVDAEYPSDIALSPEGNIYTVGFFQGSVDFDPNPNTIANISVDGSGKIFIHKLSVSSIDVYTLRPTHSISMFPNPAHGNITLSSSIDRTMRYIRILNTMGQILSEQKIDLELYTQDLSSLAAGTYLVEIEFDNSAKEYQSVILR